MSDADFRAPVSATVTKKSDTGLTCPIGSSTSACAWTASAAAASTEGSLHAIVDRPRGSTEHVSESINRKGIGWRHLPRELARRLHSHFLGLFDDRANRARIRRHGGSRRNEWMRCHAGRR